MASKRIKGITIEIGADTQQLDKAIKEFDQNISRSKGQLKDVNNLLKLDPKNTELLTQKQKALSEAIGNTEKKIQEEKKALEQLKEGPQNEKTIEQQERLSREIIANENDLKSLKKEYKDFGSVSQQQAKIAADGMKEVGKQIQDVGQGITDVGKGMTKYVTAPIVTGLTVSAKTAADFEEGMSKVQAISGATAEEMDALKEKGLEMAANSKFTAGETADAYSYMAMAGWKTEDMLNGLGGIMNLAAASGDDLASTSDIVTDALTAFGLTAKDTSDFVNVLAAAATNSNTNVEMLGQSFKYAAAPAGALGYSVNDVALGLGLMANSGIKADMAGTSLRNIFTRMAKPTKESQMAIDQLGLSLYDNEGKMYSFRDVMYQIRDGFKNVKMTAEEYDAAVAALDEDLSGGNITQEKYDAELEKLNINAFGAEEAEKARAAAMLGGTRAMSGLLAIAQASDDDFNKLADAIDRSSEEFALLADGSVVPLNDALAEGSDIIATYNGRAEAMSGQMLNNVNGQMTLLKSKLDILAESLGEVLLPKISAVVDKVSELVDKFQTLDNESKETVVNLSAFAAAIGPVLLIIGGAVTAFGKFIEALGIIKGAFAAGGIFAGAGETLAGVGAAISGLVVPIGLVVAALAVWAHNWEEIKEAGQLLVERTIEHLTEIKERWLEVWAALKEYFHAKMDEIKAKFDAAMLGIKTAVSYIWSLIQGIFKSKIEFIKGVIKGGFGFVVSTIKEKLDTAKDKIDKTIEAIKLAFETVVDLAKNWGKDMIDNFIGGIKKKADFVKAGMEGLSDTIKSYIHFSEPDVGPLSDFNTWMPDMMKQLAEQITSGIPLVEAAMQNTAGAMRAGIESVDYTDQLTSINTGISQLATAGSGVVNVTLTLDKYKLGQAVANINQINNYRSGGR